MPKWGSRFGNKRCLELRRLALWVVRTMSCQGAGSTIKWLKDAAAGARNTCVSGAPLLPSTRFLVRKILIGDVRKESLDQLSFLSRSLPEGDSVVESRTLIAHRENMSTSFHTPNHLVTDARKFAERFARRCFRRKDLVEVVTPTPSASLASSRKQGGVREEVRGLYMRWLVNSPLDIVPANAWQDSVFSSDWLDPTEVSTIRRNKSTAHVARTAAYMTATEDLKHRILTVPERGWKRRVVSAPPAFATVAGTVLNRAMLSAVARWGPCAAFLRGDRRGAVESVLRHACMGDRIVSTDLTAATDRLPLDLVRGVVDGLVDGWEGLPPVWAEALYALTGSQKLQYPWGQEVTSQSGVLMGLGPSWPLMSIIHAWWVDLAARRVGVNPRITNNITAIGGDDLLGMWPPELEESYRSLVKETNGLPSKGKDFSSTSAGNFTEMTFWVNGEVGSRPHFRWSAAIPVKGLVGTPVSEAGAAYESLGPEPGRCLRGRRVLKTLQPQLWRLCREAGVSAVAPRLLGGAGLPPMSGSLARVEFRTKHALAVGKFLYGSGQQQLPFSPPSWVEAADPAVWESRKAAEQRLRAAEEIGLVVFDTLPVPPGAKDRKLLVDSLSSQMTFFSQARVFSDTPFPPVATEMVSLKKYHRLLGRWCSSQTRGGVPSALAVKSGVNSRHHLLRRARRNRDRWAVAILVTGLSGNHRPLI
uniref:RNA-dependent RNA polymerase n=1 Tax=Rizhao Narna tick virus 1 TaxID=2972231 RepID=A0A9E8A9Y6_9VIRU|nr:MAG: RNA-dependent RNA polymerase [Rizhao Narna tick virus 1]